MRLQIFERYLTDLGNNQHVGVKAAMRSHAKAMQEISIAASELAKALVDLLGDDLLSDGSGDDDVVRVEHPDPDEAELEAENAYTTAVEV